MKRVVSGEDCTCSDLCDLYLYRKYLYRNSIGKYALSRSGCGYHRQRHLSFALPSLLALNECCTVTSSAISDPYVDLRQSRLCSTCDRFRQRVLAGAMTARTHSKV